MLILLRGDFKGIVLIAMLKGDAHDLVHVHAGFHRLQRDVPFVRVIYQRPPRQNEPMSSPGVFVEKLKYGINVTLPCQEKNVY